MFATQTCRRLLNSNSANLLCRNPTFSMFTGHLWKMYSYRQLGYLFSTTKNPLENLVSCHKLESYIKCDKTIQALMKKGINELFPIQANSYDHIFRGSDIIASDRTGSGKTIAFTLPIVQRLRKEGFFDIKNKKSADLKYIIMAPTRELAVQTTAEINSLNHYRNQIRVATIIGGADMREQKNQLRNGAHILVATPGRLMDFYNRGDLNFSNVEVVCIDEADLMLEKGFKADIQFILERIHSQTKNKPQHLFFSATMPSWVIDLTEKFMGQDKKYLNMIESQQTKTSKTVNHLAIISEPQNRVKNIKYLINKYSKGGSVLIFTARKVEADFLQEDLKLKNCVLHGDINQTARNRRISDFRTGKSQILIATDVAARGLDIPHVQLIIQYNAPQNVSSYIHRSGRTGRAGRQGTCVSLINPFLSVDKQLLLRIKKEANVEFQAYKIVPSDSNQGELELQNVENFFQMSSGRRHRGQQNYSYQKQSLGEIDPITLKLQLKSNIVNVDFEGIKKQISLHTNSPPIRINKIYNRNGKVTIFVKFSTAQMCDAAKNLKSIKVEGEGENGQAVSQLTTFQKMIIFEPRQRNSNSNSTHRNMQKNFMSKNEYNY